MPFIVSVAEQPGFRLLDGSDFNTLGTNINQVYQGAVATRVVTTPVITALATDCVIVASPSPAGPVVVNLPKGTINTMIVVKDGSGLAGTYTFNIYPSALDATPGIDQNYSYSLPSAYSSVRLVFNGSVWNVIQ